MGPSLTSLTLFQASLRPSPGEALTDRGRKQEAVLVPQPVLGPLDLQLASRSEITLENLAIIAGRLYCPERPILAKPKRLAIVPPRAQKPLHGRRCAACGQFPRIVF